MSDNENAPDTQMKDDVVPGEIKRIEPFPTAIQDWLGVPLTVAERQMVAFMGSITDKPDWQRKIEDSSIREKWRKELDGMPHTSHNGADTFISPPEAFDHCMAELADYAKCSEKHEFLPGLDATATIYKSDALVSNELRQRLLGASAKLEDSQASDPDWHPGSDNTVLDLVHPSLFPLVYGRTPVMKEPITSLRDIVYYTGLGSPIAGPGDVEEDRDLGSFYYPYESGSFSDRFQWLPCEVAVGQDGHAKITSYINNLLPETHTDLYEAIEEVIARSLPVLSATLVSTRETGRLPRISVGSGEDIEWTPAKPKIEDFEPDQNDDDGDDAYERFDAEMDNWRDASSAPSCPPPATYSGRARNPADFFKKFDLQRDFASQGLQFIVKLANIVLTPNKPKYAGGSWHVEGQMNEHICATALFYYDCDNITDSHLAFRESLSTDFDVWSYEQSEYQHHEILYDIENEGPPEQRLGSVLTQQGRLLTFPNVMQHRVEPFELDDKTRPGHRKILALFLVDPYLRIPSTATVPPQQKHWWTEMVQNLDKIADLPPEMVEHVLENSGDFPIDMKEAKTLRAELMEERSAWQSEVDDKLYEDRFCFCEH
ncbi:hypothetical protein LTR86_000795 [Recurvomyces mirabilis]|nr:hypothetical protein LTR86_000795 [Recurvomyces mirabilis]